ncbi:binding-protein-dependent transport systems inner membrane component [Beutenbergia cavernae DSM 12333]|uniref:Binding-protein-dependent transport systems inner membrane component n=1 Tax=Beutenbergia cavernae (strain ATCC BAA-8 / DSM 12333 / CCUG 43141 / JCM 11478 / NBRC 16432 / NCIMB 13614 / HKI 0122) TaxID=471853 RepID=C5C2L1_BEUC1|nr:carbohydrate ABC transporter permease [Beutenbergia cavernae]ACQ79697.1 binding-protein-dependent transport systems inner membrane component [Beutenbergia cavernae DSM 12333]
MSRRRIHGTPVAAWPVQTLKAVLLGTLCVLVLLPFLAVISTSLAGQDQLSRAGGLVLWPHGVHLDAYRSILSGGVVTRAVLVSVGITLVGTALSLFTSCLLAYGLSRPRSFGSRPALLVVLFSMLFSAGIIPTYLLVKQVGLIDSWWALILPTMISGFNVVVLRSFFMNVPSELLESARIDGAGEWVTFSRIVLPLSKAVLAVVGLFYAVGYWNAFFNALLYLNDSAKWPLQLVLRTYVINETALASTDLGTAENLPSQSSIQMAILVLSIVPILVIYPFLQRHFAKGVLTGAVKG